MVPPLGAQLADVVKLVDTLGLDSNAAMFESSSLSIRILLPKVPYL